MLGYIPLFFIFWVGFNISGIAIPAILGLIFCFIGLILKYKIEIPKSLFVILVWLNLYALFSILYLEVLDAKRLIGFYILQFAIIVGAVSANKLDLRSFSLFALIIFSVAFYLQFLTYYLLGVYLDIGGIFGIESRNLGGIFQSTGSIARFDALVWFII